MELSVKWAGFKREGRGVWEGAGLNKGWCSYKGAGLKWKGWGLKGSWV